MNLEFWAAEFSSVEAMTLWTEVGLAVAIVAYLLGAVPTGYWAGRILKGIDIREHGSKSTGATNVLRTLGKVPALVVLLIDVFKGVAAIGIARELCFWVGAVKQVPLAAERWLPWMVMLAALMAILGHSRSIWINFTGGKSAATGLGTLLAMSWQVGLGSFAAFGLVLAVFRVVSLGSISAAITAIVLMYLCHQPLAYLLMTIAGGLYVIWRHQANIQRLLDGTEPRIGQQPASTISDTSTTG